MTICSNSPPVCCVNKITLLVPIESEPPSSRIVNVKHVWCLKMLRRAASDGSQPIASEKEENGKRQQPDVAYFHSMYLLHLLSLILMKLSCLWSPTFLKPVGCLLRGQPKPAVSSGRSVTYWQRSWSSWFNPRVQMQKYWSIIWNNWFDFYSISILFF